MPETPILFQQLGISAVLGLLVGLQRERTPDTVAGLRTFPLITLLGTVSAIMTVALGDAWILAAGLLAVVAVVAVGHLLKIRSPAPDMGTTTDFAELLMFAVGALVVLGPTVVAVAVGGGVAVLLQFKGELHGLARQLGEKDLKAIMQFVLITCIILPVVPNRTFGSYDVLNPFEIWLMVVLIVGMSLAGYIIYKFFGSDAGILLAGALGGAVSSTATTVSSARRARGSGIATRSAAVVILIASSITYIRIFVEIAVVGSRELLWNAALPLAAMMALTLLPALVLWFRVRRHVAQLPEPENPTQLKSAVVFAGMYSLVLLGLAAAEDFRGEIGAQGMYWVAGLSGLTDMDAITLSTARMSLEDGHLAQHGWRLIVVAIMANMPFKAMMAGALGGRRLLGSLAGLFAVPMIGGAALLWLL
ncbi:MAG: MgtC/SapB family protein [Patescibacteria group bacterium]|nr:MgtC/SapB family protein [Patescibacteria group bacterium]